MTTYPDPRLSSLRYRVIELLQSLLSRFRGHRYGAELAEPYYQELGKTMQVILGVPNYRTLPIKMIPHPSTNEKLEALAICHPEAIYLNPSAFKPNNELTADDEALVRFILAHEAVHEKYMDPARLFPFIVFKELSLWLALFLSGYSWLFVCGKAEITFMDGFIVSSSFLAIVFSQWILRGIQAKIKESNEQRANS